MKKILTLLLTLISFVAISQNELETPRYLIENGDTIGIVLSVEQVQNLDNKTELLYLFEKLQINCDSVNSHYIEVINSSDEKIGLLEVKVSELISQGNEKDGLIKNLKEQVAKMEEDNNLCDSQLKNKDSEIKLLKEDLRKEKFKKWLSTAGNVALGVVAIILIVK
jgi:predicted RNase H-like nuclease (RuvC/YqgF family)